MTCSETLDLAPLYRTGELDSPRAAKVADHLSQCAACRQEFAEETAFDQSMRTALLSEPIDTSTIDDGVRTRIQSARRPHRWIMATAGVASVLAVGIVAAYKLQVSQPTPLDSAAARDHHVELVDHQPRRWLSDRAAIEALVVKQGLQPSLVSRLTPSGYHFAQGRLCFLHGQIFLHLVYENNAGNVSVFLRHADEAGDSKVQLINLAAENVARFQRGDLTAVLVTNQSSQTVRYLAESAAAAL